MQNTELMLNCGFRQKLKIKFTTEMRSVWDLQTELNFTNGVLREKNYYHVNMHITKNHKTEQR